ncbi:MAG: preprotein translocase subunit YajC [Syntrophomonadaceae bacterium]
MPANNSLITLVLYFAGFIAIFYVFIIQPRKKQEKRHKELLETLKRGEKVVTIGGIRGEVTRIKEKTVMIKVSDNTEIEFLKTAVAYRADEVE